MSGAWLLGTWLVLRESAVAEPTGSSGATSSVTLSVRSSLKVKILLADLRRSAGGLKSVADPRAHLFVGELLESMCPLA